MKEELISKQCAKLAKEKGFKIPTRFCYSNTDEYALPFNNGLYENDLNYYSAPTQSLLQRWLREVHSIHVEVFSWYIGNYYGVNIFKGHNDENLFDIDWAGTNDYHKENNTSSIYKYEEALERGLIEGLKLIKGN